VFRRRYPNVSLTPDAGKTNFDPSGASYRAALCRLSGILMTGKIIPVAACRNVMTRSAEFPRRGPRKFQVGLYYSIYGSPNVHSSSDSDVNSKRSNAQSFSHSLAAARSQLDRLECLNMGAGSCEGGFLGSLLSLHFSSSRRDVFASCQVAFSP